MSIDKSNFPVPNYYSNIQTSSFISKRNLYGKDLKQLAYNANYIVGNNGVALPLTRFIFNYGNVGNRISSSVRLLLPIPQNSKTRLWGYQYAASTNNIFNIDVSSSANGITSQLMGSNGYYTPSLFIENNKNFLTTLSPFLFDTNVLVSGTASALATLYSLNAYNGPAVYLNPTTIASEYAVNVKSCGINEPLYSAPYNENSSIGGIVKQIKNFESTAIKPLWTWATTYNVGGSVNWINSVANNMPPWYVTGSVRTNVFTLNDDATPFIFATQKDTGVNSKTCTFYAYAGLSATGNIGRIELTSSLGTSFITVGSTVPAWVSGSIVIPTEDLADYPQNPVNPNMINALTGNLTINMYKSTSTNTGSFTIWSFQIFETF